MRTSHKLWVAASVSLMSAGIGPAYSALQEIVVRDPSAEETVLFTADTVYREREDGPVIAEGKVRAFFGERALTADRVVYDPQTEIVTAEGNVVVYDEAGDAFYAEQVELTGDLRDGVATNFGAMIGNQNRIVGSSVVRRSSGVNEINNGKFTPCEVCRENGKDKTPTWQVNAVKVIQDTNDKVIRFRHARIEALGVPIFYTPYFQYPDPSVKRKTGFLAPSFGNSSRAGAEAEIPYYIAISDHQDATFAPRFTTGLGTLWKGEYRTRSHDGGAIVQAGIINPEGIVRASNGALFVLDGLRQDQIDRLPEDAFDEIGPRWHVFGEARKELRDDWVATADIDFVSDRNYLRTYDIQPEGQLREAIDILQPDRLENELHVSRLTDRSYTDVSSILFQSLRFSDDPDFTADVLPSIRHEYSFPIGTLGGDLRLTGDFLQLHRPEGLDTTRLVADATWQRNLTTPGGHRFRTFAQVRGDLYRNRDANLGIQACRNPQVPGGDFVIAPQYERCRDALPRQGGDDPEAEFSFARFLPTAAVEWSYPLAKFTDNASFIIEPRIQVVAAPDADYTDDVFIQDSSFLQFDSVTLFDVIKSTGFDLWEDGQRVNIGVAGSALFDNGFTVSGTVGQQYRFSETEQFPDDLGLGDQRSDLVGDLEIDYGRKISVVNRFRLDDEDLRIRRLETILRGQSGPISGSINYLLLESPALDGFGDRDEFVSATAFYRVTDQIDLGGVWRRNLDTQETTEQRVILRYRDDCTIFNVTYRFDNRTGDGFENNTSVTFNIDIVGF